METVLIVAVLVPWALIGFLCFMLYQLLRSHGQALFRQEDLTARLDATEQSLRNLSSRVEEIAARPAAVAPAPAPAAPAGLAIGSAAPDFELPDLNGQPRRLRDFLGRPLLVVFWDTQCGFCVQMAPRLGQLPAEGPRVLLVSRRDAESNRRLVAENGIRADVVIEPEWTVASSYGTNGTPTGYLLDAEGRVASDLSVGADALLALYISGGANGHANGHASGLTADSLREKQQAVEDRARAAGLAVRESKLNREGLKAGTKAPGFTLPDLSQRKHSLTEFRGKRVLLVFSDPACGPCQALVPSLVDLDRNRRGDMQVVMISRGDLAENMAKVKEHGIEFPVLMQKHWEVSKDYAMFATPIGYLIDEKGAIARDVAVGGDAILALVASGVAT